MYYRFAITVPSGTTKGSPQRTNLKLTWGTITQVSISFPAGCMGLAGIRLKRYEHVVWPSNPEEWLAYEDIDIQFPERFPIFAAPTELIAETYNEDDTYDHELTVRIAMEIPEVDWERYQAQLLEEMLKMFPQLVEEVRKVVEREPGLFEIARS